MYIGLSTVSVYLLLLPDFSVSKDYHSRTTLVFRQRPSCVADGGANAP